MTPVDRKGAAALAAAARAFERAKTKGYVWVDDQGSFATWDYTGIWQMPDPIHEDQLRLDDITD